MTRWVLALLLVLPVRAQERGDLVLTRSGDLPILLSAPHGGRQVIPGSPERVSRGEPNFYTTGDDNTLQLAELAADELEKETGKRPYLVAACFHRRFCDANRPAEHAYQSEPAAQCYAAYHGALQQYSEEIARRFPHGIVVDVHGQSADKGCVFRGTQNGSTVQALLERCGAEALQGADSIPGILSALGYPVKPLAVDQVENEHYDGGYIVRTYGSANGGPLDALQLEFGRNFRSKERLGETASALATALVRFWRRYL